MSQSLAASSFITIPIIFQESDFDKVKDSGPHISLPLQFLNAIFLSHTDNAPYLG